MARDVGLFFSCRTMCNACPIPSGRLIYCCDNLLLFLELRGEQNTVLSHMNGQDGQPCLCWSPTLNNLRNDLPTLPGLQVRWQWRCERESASLTLILVTSAPFPMFWWVNESTLCDNARNVPVDIGVTVQNTRLSIIALWRPCSSIRDVHWWWWWPRSVCPLMTLWRCSHLLCTYFHFHSNVLYWLELGTDGPDSLMRLH